MLQSHQDTYHTQDVTDSILNQKQRTQLHKAGEGRPKIVVMPHAIKRARQRGLISEGRFGNRKRIIRLLYAINCCANSRLTYLGYKDINYLLIEGIYNQDNYRFIFCYAKNRKKIFITSVWTEDMYDEKFNQTFNRRRNLYRLTQN